MSVLDTQYIEWSEHFDQEVAKHPELDELLVESIRADLQAKEKQLKSHFRLDDRQRQSQMVAEVRSVVNGALQSARQRLRLQRYDEWRYGLRLSRAAVVAGDSDAIYDELDDLLLDVQQDSDTSGDGVVSTVSDSAFSNQGTVSVELDGEPADTCSLGQPVLVNYEFPDTEHLQAKFALLSNAELRVQIEFMLNQRGSDGQLVPYLQIRDECCAIGEVMNRRGIQPPKLRPQRSLPMLPKGQKYDVPDTVMSRDRQVLDLHWLHCRGKRDRIEHKAYGDLFTGDEFDFDLAVQFACKGWSLASKTVKVLDLIDFEQMQMAFFRMKHIDDAWKNGLSSMNTTISKRLREYVVKEPDFAVHIEGLKRLWLAEKMVVAAGLCGEKIIGQVYGWLMNEEPLAKGTLNSKLKRMRRRTAPKSRRS